MAEKKTGGSKKSQTASKKSASTKKQAAAEEAARADERQLATDVPQPTEHRKELIEEIVSIAERLDDDGLELLLEQAKVVEYKGKIEQFNRRLNVAAHQAIEARREAGRPDYHVTVERTEDDFFVIQLDDARVFFNRNEMRELTRICHKAKDEAAGARNLFRWFERERSDLLADTGIASNRSPYLRNLYELIVNTYKVGSGG